jgi:two-component system, chemotaxis family, protein-glutamate methylesterase/glutaminase
MSARPIRLLIVDDSALAQKSICASVAPYREIEVVGTATDPYIARDKILELKPDVITLDLEMPRMDGITFLRAIMKHRPLPVIIISSLTPSNSQNALDALQAGAVDVMEKAAGLHSDEGRGAVLAEKIRAAAGARLRVESSPPPLLRTKLASGDGGKPRVFPARNIILMGASTGGIEALKIVLTSMRGDLPGICIVQHIPPRFSKTFAERMSEICPMQFREAQDGDVVKPGLALLAPGDHHMVLKWEAGAYHIRLSQEAPRHHQRPAVDVLFDSAVQAGAGPHAAAVLLTGMGVDGAAGLLHLAHAGAATVAQSQETCAVFGMPREAIRLGAAKHIVPLEQIGPRLDKLISNSFPATEAKPGLGVREL